MKERKNLPVKNHLVSWHRFMYFYKELKITLVMLWTVYYLIVRFYISYIGSKGSAPKVVPKKSATAKPVPKSSLKNKKPQPLDSESDLDDFNKYSVSKLKEKSEKSKKKAIEKTKSKECFMICIFFVILKLLKSNYPMRV